LHLFLFFVSYSLNTKKVREVILKAFNKSLILIISFFSFALQAAVSEDSEGWTVVTSSADTRIIYVSSSMGSDTNDGLSEDYPVQTLERAYSLLRDSCPDWMLLRCGDEWYENIPSISKSGRSADEPILISSYGEGEKPLIKSESGSVISNSGHAFPEHIFFIGLDLYSYKREPSSEDYDESVTSNRGIRWVGGGNDILVEDCCFRFFSGGLVVQKYTASQLTDFKLRRSIITDSYSTNSHSQGFYAHNIDGLLVEECIFDHNGWLIQGTGDNSQEGGAATMFNHNTYFNECNDVVIKGNIFLRPSSIGNKMCSNIPDGSIGILIDNNLYVEGEVGISIGGNTEELSRFCNVVIKNNVMLHIGRSNPTSRNFGWYLDISDNNNCVVSNNCFVHQPWYDNTYAVNIGGESEENILISNNTIHDIRYQAIRVRINTAWNNVQIFENIIQDDSLGPLMVHQSGNFEEVSYYDNTYYTSDISNFARLDGEYLTYDEWISASGETGAINEEIDFTDPNRTVESYYSSIGGNGTFEGFIAEACQQSKDNWNTAFTASAVNDYIREGFDMEKLDTTAIDFDSFAKSLILQINPNPFNTLTVIRYHVPQTGSMKLVVYDMLGRKVRTLIDGLVSSGTYGSDWNGTDDDGNRLSTGIYFCHISGEHGIPDSKKMILLK
jgi:hypothetical protein